MLATCGGTISGTAWLKSIAVEDGTLTAPNRAGAGAPERLVLSRIGSRVIKLRALAACTQPHAEKAGDAKKLTRCAVQGGHSMQQQASKGSIAANQTRMTRAPGNTHCAPPRMQHARQNLLRWLHRALQHASEHDWCRCSQPNPSAKRLKFGHNSGLGLGPLPGHVEKRTDSALDRLWDDPHTRVLSGV